MSQVVRWRWGSSPCVASEEEEQQRVLPPLQREEEEEEEEGPPHTSPPHWNIRGASSPETVDSRDPAVEFVTRSERHSVEAQQRYL